MLSLLSTKGSKFGGLDYFKYLCNLFKIYLNEKIL